MWHNKRWIHYRKDRVIRLDGDRSQQQLPHPESMGKLASAAVIKARILFGFIENIAED